MTMGSGMLMGMMGPGMGGLGGSTAVGFSAGRMNPSMNAAMSILSAATAPSATGADDGSSERATDTVLDGLSKVGKQVADDLKKGKGAPIR